MIGDDAGPITRLRRKAGKLRDELEPRFPVNAAE